MGLFSFIKDIVTSFNPISFLFNTAISWVIGEIAVDDLEQELDAKYSGTLVNKSSNIAQIPVIYGERKVGGVRSFVATSGNDNQYLYMVLAICEGEVDSIGDIYINDVISTDSKYSGLVSITKYTGTDTQTADSTLVNANIGWTSAHRLRGVAYLAIRLKWDNNVFGGIPTFHAVVRGRKVYDPATNTTAWSDNPALCLRDYLTNTRYGKGLSSAAIDDTLFNAAKTKCDTSVTPYANGTARSLFSCNAVLDTSKTLMSNVKVLLSGMRGIMPYQQGKYGLIIEDQGNASFDFTEDHIIGSLTIQSEQKNSKYNRVIATFANPDANWQMDEIEYPAAGSSEESGYLTADGVELIGRIDLPTITDIYTAEDIAEITLKRSRNALSVGFNATSEALNCAVGDIVSVTHSTPSWDEKTFRVTSLSLNADGTVGVELVEHQDSIYPWTQKTEKDDIPDTNLPDPFITAPVTNLSVVPRALDTFDGTIVSVLDITWTASVDQFVSQYEVTITPSSGDASVVVTSNTNYRFQVLDINATYVVGVKPINAMGVYGASVGSSSITPVADTTAPSAPTNPNVTGTFKKIILDWDNPTDSDFSYIEIKRSNDSQEVNASVIGKTSATQFIDEPYTGNTTRYFWIRAVDTSGNASAWVSMGSGTSIRIDAGDFDDGVISPDFINQDFTNSVYQNNTDTRVINNKLESNALSNLKQVIDSHKNRESNITNFASVRSEITQTVTDNNQAIASNKTELLALIADNESAITTEQTARTNADSALASDISALSTTVNDSSTGVAATATGLSNLTTTVNNQSQTLTSQASSINALSTTVGSNTTSITEATQSINGIKAQYSVTVDNNGHVSGFGLVSDIIDGNATSAFIIDADQFAIGSSGNYPFVYYANQTTVTKDGVDYDLAAGVYLQDAHIQNGAINSAHIQDATINTAHIDSLDASVITAGTIDANRIGVNDITADKIDINGNIDFSDNTSGIVFGKTSLADTTEGMFYGRSLDVNGNSIAGFYISSSSAGIYADTSGNLTLSNVKIFTGTAGTKSEFSSQGQHTANLSSLTTQLSIEIIGGGAGSCSNGVPSVRSGSDADGGAGEASWIKFYSGQNGTGTQVGQTYTASGGAATSHSVMSNTYDGTGASGQTSSKANSAGSGGTMYVDTSAPSSTNYPTAGSLGGGGGAAGANGRNGSAIAVVNAVAQSGSTVSQQITVPTGAQSVKIYVGAGGSGGVPSGSGTVYYDNGVPVYKYMSGRYISCGRDGGDGYVSIADPYVGGVEVDLVDLMNRVTALENN